MTIDFAAIADQFRAPLTAQTALITPLFDKLADAVKDLVAKADDAERVTRAYPILRYRDGAVGVRLALGPEPTLVTTADPGVAEALRRHGTGFLDGLSWPRVAVQQELALNDIAGTVLGALRAVSESLDRYATAAPAMFDDRRARFSDIFGLLNLGWSAMLGRANQAQLRDAATGLRAGSELADILGGLSPSGPADPSAPALPAGLPGLSEKLDEKAKLLLDVMLLLPVVGLTLDVALHEGVLIAEADILDALAPVESSVYDLRAAVVDAWIGTFPIGTTAHLFTAAADIVIGLDIVLLTGAMPLWCGALLDAVEHLLTGIRIWGVWTGAFVRVFQAAVDDLMAVDLMPWIAANLLPSWLAGRVPLPTFTLDDVVAFAAGEGDTDVRDNLVDFLDNVDDLLWVVPGSTAARYRSKVQDLRRVIDITLTPTPFTMPADVLPTGPLAPFPNVYDAFFSGSARAELLDSVRRLGAQAHTSVVGTLRAGADLSLGLAETARVEGERQATFGAGLALARRERQSRAIVGDLFGPLRADVAARAAGAPPDPLAVGFDEALAVGGIAAAAAAVPAYVREMREFWAARSQPLPTAAGPPPAPPPTSAHILARRGRLGVVRVPRMTVRAAGHPADAELAEATAERFRGAVTQAYRDGRARIATLAEPAPAPRARTTRAGTRSAGHPGGERRGR